MKWPPWWKTRPLNTVVRKAYWLGSLPGNQITLPAGEWTIRCDGQVQLKHPEGAEISIHMVGGPGERK